MSRADMLERFPDALTVKCGCESLELYSSERPCPLCVDSGVLAKTLEQLLNEIEPPLALRREEYGYLAAAKGFRCFSEDAWEAVAQLVVMLRKGPQHV